VSARGAMGVMRDVLQGRPLSGYRIELLLSDGIFFGPIAPSLHPSSSMKKPIQYNLFKADVRFFGGALLKGKRKSLRPLSTKDPIHVVMRSTWAKKEYSFLKPVHTKAIHKILGAMGKRFQVKIYQTAVQGNHIHLVIKIPHRIQYKAFIKAISGKIAQTVMKAPSFEAFLENLSRNGTSGGDGRKERDKIKSFWELRPFTRVLLWGKDFKKCLKYLTQNTLEAIGFIQYKERKNYYARFVAAHTNTS
jgi:putative transposase